MRMRVMSPLQKASVALHSGLFQAPMGVDWSVSSSKVEP